MVRFGAEMVKEIRDAAEVREKVLLSKVETLIDNCLNSKNMVRILAYFVERSLCNSCYIDITNALLSGVYMIVTSRSN